MKLKDSYSRPGHPEDTILGFEEPQEINRVFLSGPFRLRIVRRITREEAARRFAENQKYPTASSGMATYAGDSKVDTDVPEHEGELPDLPYFYEAEII